MQTVPFLRFLPAFAALICGTPSLLAQTDLVASFNVGEHTGTLRQRGSSATWDIVWTRGEQRVVAVLEGDIEDGQIRLRRVSSSDGVLCQYRGTVGSDGRTLSGTQSCPGYPDYGFSGRIRSGELGAKAETTRMVLRMTCDNWACTWTQRGSSTTWDAVWTRPSERVTAVLQGTISGGQVRLRRVSSSDGVLCEYRGTMDARGRVSLVQTCPGYPTITCSGPAGGGEPAAPAAPAPASPATASGDLGRSIVMMQGNVCASILTRTRPSVYDALTICQGPATSSFRETLTVESYDGRNVVIQRPGYGRYRGTVAGNGRVLRGTCDWSGCTSGYRWTAYLDWDWNEAPPVH